MSLLFNRPRVRQRWLWWDWFDGSLSVREGTTNTYRALFSLWPVRCALCKSFKWGCGEHWLCQCCEECRISIDKLEESA